MTHIDANIRESSLSMLDILISKQPSLTARHCEPVILPAFLDLISTKFVDSDRKLSLQYSNKMSTNVWRIKVLTRLQALLSAIVNIHADTKSGYYFRNAKILIVYYIFLLRTFSEQKIIERSM